MKKIIIPVIIIILVVVAINFAAKNEKEEYNLAEVKKGTVSQEISETGQVKKGEEINLTFKNSGTISKIYVEVGEEIKEGDVLAKLDTSNLYIQLQEAKAGLALYQAQLDKLLAGATEEEIQAAETAVANAQKTLENEKIDLENAEAQAEDDLGASYEDALNDLDDAYLKAYNSYNFIDSIQRIYFTSFDQEGIKVRENKEKIKSAVSQIENYLDSAKSSSQDEDIDTYISEIKILLNDIFTALSDIRDVCESASYRNTVSSTDKTSLDTHKTNINTALSTITDAQQAISSTKLTNESNINTAKASVSTAEGALKSAQDDLAILTASPQQEDIDLYQAQIDQAKAKVQNLENQIFDSSLRSPVEGQITKISKKEGESVQPTLQDGFIVILPTDPFKIETDIYEEDIVKVKVGNLVDISLVAFPDEDFKGKVISIDPAEKIVNEVVYYEVDIDFEEMPEGIKPGMTADVTIKTMLKENVLTVPEDAVLNKDGKKIVKIFEGEEVKEKEIVIGLEGSNDLVEIISGLSEGEKVIIPE